MPLWDMMTDEWTLANVGRNDDEEDDYGLGLVTTGYTGYCDLTIYIF